ncbi:MAG: hypothetical protein OXB95_02925 [Rhodobacteraceae bacterium]|nr:hypothetical protein [Paracoccaceae bacterium]
MQTQAEGTFNRALADALRSINPHWDEHVCRPEIIGMLEAGRQLRLDVLITEPTAPPVAIECSYVASDADRDAQDRLELTLVETARRIDAPFDAAIAVVIPEEFRNLRQSLASRALCAGTTFGMALFQRRSDGFERFPEGGGHIVARLDNLSDLLAAAAVTDERVNSLTQQVALRIRQAANNFVTIPERMRRQIAATVQHSVIDGLRVVTLMWFNALMAQHQLHRSGVADVGPIHFEPALQPVSAEYLTQWRRILEVNWNAIFLPAVQALEIACNYEYEMRTVMELLNDAARELDTARLGRHVNVGAELFPLLSEDRKEAAAFYTTAGTAEFLARLAIRDVDLPASEWRRRDLYGRHRLADLACGTGSLLLAGYHRIGSLSRRHGGRPDAAMHRMAMEQGIVGVDVSPLATHLTASSLAGLGDQEPYGHTNIGWVDVGRPVQEAGQATTGSLEYLASNETANLYGEGHGRAAGQEAPHELIVVEDESIDWILMNPPYNRTRGGQTAFDIAGLNDCQRRQFQKRWRALVKRRPANKTAGMAASFLMLACQKLRCHGRLGFVLPLTAAFAESWAKTRAMIENGFTDIVAVTIGGDHHAGPQSEDTGISEMMLFATRRADNGVAAEPVSCVTLNVAPTRNGIAGELARAVAQAAGELEGVDDDTRATPVILANASVGTAVRHAETGRGDPWFPLGVQSATLSMVARHLVQGRLLAQDWRTHAFAVPMTTISELFKVGPSHDLIGCPRGSRSPRGSFVVDALPDNQMAGLDGMLWSHNHASQTSLLVTPTHSGTPRDGQDIARIRETASTLFYARNLRWNTQKLVAASAARPTMGGRSWVSLRHDNPNVLKAAALWFNSTPGIVVHWTRGQRTDPGRAPTQITAVKRMPAPRFDALSEEQLERSAECFDALCERPLRRIVHANDDPVRSQLDAHVCDMLGLPQQTRDDLSEWCRHLCNEPSVQG